MKPSDISLPFCSASYSPGRGGGCLYGWKLAWKRIGQTFPSSNEPFQILFASPGMWHLPSLFPPSLETIPEIWETSFHCHHCLQNLPSLLPASSLHLFILLGCKFSSAASYSSHCTEKCLICAEISQCYCSTNPSSVVIVNYHEKTFFKNIIFIRQISYWINID